VKGRGTTIGLEKDGELVAGVLYEDYNGANVLMHVAAIPGRKWLNRTFLYICFTYPFVQLDCRRVTGIVPSTNWDALRFDIHLGFEVEAVLKDAHPSGDLMVLRMFRENCRWIGANHGQIKRASRA